MQIENLLLRLATVVVVSLTIVVLGQAPVNHIQAIGETRVYQPHQPSEVQTNQLRAIASSPNCEPSEDSVLSIQVSGTQNGRFSASVAFDGAEQMKYFETSRLPLTLGNCAVPAEENEIRICFQNSSAQKYAHVKIIDERERVSEQDVFLQVSCASKPQAVIADFGTNLIINEGGGH